MAGNLSVVPPGASAPRRKRPVTIKAAVELGERDLLVAMRAKAAADLDSGVPAHVVAPLMRQLREIDKEIRLLDTRSAQESESVASVPDEPFDASAI